MTRRERLERKLKKREEWADKAAAHSASTDDRIQNLEDRVAMQAWLLRLGDKPLRETQAQLANLLAAAVAVVEERSNRFPNWEQWPSGPLRTLADTIREIEPDALAKPPGEFDGIDLSKHQGSESDAAWLEASDTDADTA